MSKDVILLTDTIIGTTTEKELGEKLMISFLYTLCNLEDDELPSHIILYTDAAHLVKDNSQIKDHFLELKEKGVDILVCGACTDFFEIKDLCFARVSNMYEIVLILNNAKKVIRP